MTEHNDNLTPQERLAQIVAEETDGGRLIVRFFKQVLQGERDSEGFQPNHKMDSAKQLVKIGLSQFQDYIDANSSPPKPRNRRQSEDDADISPQLKEAREELANYARELTQDGRTVIKMYADVMDGLRNDEGFQPHHRIAAGRELLLRGFGPASSWHQPEPSPADSQIIDRHQNQTNHGSDRAHAPQTQDNPTLTLTPSVSEYLSDAVESYEERSPLRQLLPQDIQDIIDSDDPLDECPCAIAESEGRDIPCTENDECPYYGLEFPKFTQEDRERIKEYAMRGLRMRAETLGLENLPEPDP